MEASLIFVTFLTFSSVSSSEMSQTSKSCTKSDFVRMELPCDPVTRTRSVVYYQNSTCKPGNTSVIPKPIFGLPCVCKPGKGLTPDNKCQSCRAGQYSAGGEILNRWNLWTKNGTVPPRDAAITVYCDSFHSYVTPCQAWKASDDQEYLESGDNTNTRCLQSVMVIKRQFVSDDSYISFDYHVQGRKCYNSYVGCDGLSFFVDDKKLLKVNTLFRWTSFKANITKGYHRLKWVYRKNCYSFNRPEFLDKAYIRSIIMVGVIQPNSECHDCPKGSCSNTTGAAKCTKCRYFQYQDKPGQTSCKTCSEGLYSMIGDSICSKLRNCTKDDIINAPGNITTCKPKGEGKAVTTVIPKYHEMPGMNGKLLCYGEQLSQKPQERPCRCQPGFRVTAKSSTKDQFQCTSCDRGFYSNDGITCRKCPAGQVALTGKHYYYWPQGPLPQGFKSECVGNCHKEGGWLPSGDFVRTGHAIGDVDSYIETPEYDIVSSVAELAFNCSIQCNVTEPKGRIAGAHLADPKDCLLTLKVYKDGNISESINCTRPKGRYVYRHHNNRDGRTVFHRLRLTEKGKYKFRWQFHQSDETRSLSANFEAKLSSISVVGVPGGEARNCTQCPAGFFSFADRTDCGICGKGNYSSAGSNECKECPDGTFAPKAGSSGCLRCGRNTKASEKKDSCHAMGCTFSPKSNVVYDLNMLSRSGGNMFSVVVGRQRRLPRTTWIPPSEFYVNLCTLNHTNSSCTFRRSRNSLKIPIPTMACRSSWYGIRDFDIGNVIGYIKKSDITSGLTVELLHGDRCWNKGKYFKYNTTIDMICDINAGVGQPMFNQTSYYPRPVGCTYKLVWRSLYACPKCQKEFYRRVVTYCQNGIRNVRYIQITPCWGTAEGIPLVPDETSKLCNETTNSTELPTVVVTRTVFVNFTGDGHVGAARVIFRSTVNKILIGVGVVVVVALIIVAVFFFYKHRTLQYQYFSMATRNKPMSTLEEEEEDLTGNFDGAENFKI